MKIRPLPIDGAFEITLVAHGDERGTFVGWFRGDLLGEETGHRPPVAQANISVSARGVVRGIHFAQTPPGQAKYVTCVRGEVFDVVVDLRIGSPTFGTWTAVTLAAGAPRAVYLAAGLGHGFCATTDDATVVYLCSETYNPAREHTVDPMDRSLGIRWPATHPRLSPRDAAAPDLAAAAGAGLLPSWTGVPV